MTASRSVLALTTGRRASSKLFQHWKGTQTHGAAIRQTRCYGLDPGRLNGRDSMRAASRPKAHKVNGERAEKI